MRERQQMEMNHHLMAKLAANAYLDSEAKPIMKKLGFTGHKFFDVDGAQCHAVWNKEVYVLCFRGTEPDELSDVLADLNAIPRGAMTHGWVHSGFRMKTSRLMAKANCPKFANRTSDSSFRVLT